MPLLSSRPCSAVFPYKLNKRLSVGLSSLLSLLAHRPDFNFSLIDILILIEAFHLINSLILSFNLIEIKMFILIDTLILI